MVKFRMLTLPLLVVVGSPCLADRQGSGVCLGLSGAQRTSCLEAEVRRAKQETERINRYNRNLDRAKTATCVLTRSSTAGAAGGAVGDAALRQDRPCTPRAQ